jgi:hypothetical protein
MTRAAVDRKYSRNWKVAGIVETFEASIVHVLTATSSLCVFADSSSTERLTQQVMGSAVLPVLQGPQLGPAQEASPSRQLLAKQQRHWKSGLHGRRCFK